MVLVKVAMLALLVFMIMSPKLFFNWLDEYLFKEEPVNNTVAFVDTTRQIQLDSYGLDLEEKRIQNIQKMIDSAPNPDIRRIWEVKKAEFLRNTRWNRLVEFSNASSR